MASEFKKMFPNGLNRTICLFEKAIKNIMETEEIDTLIKNSEEYEAEHLEEFKKAALEALGGKPFYDWHWIPILDSIQSVNLLKDIIAYMIGMDYERITEAEDGEIH